MSKEVRTYSIALMRWSHENFAGDGPDTPPIFDPESLTELGFLFGPEVEDYAKRARVYSVDLASLALEVNNTSNREANVEAWTKLRSLREEESQAYIEVLRVIEDALTLQDVGRREGSRPAIRFLDSLKRVPALTRLIEPRARAD